VNKGGFWLVTVCPLMTIRNSPAERKALSRIGSRNEKANPPGLASRRSRLQSAGYLSAAAPASAARASIKPVGEPLTPIAPMILPSTMIGTPPAAATTPGYNVAT